MASRSHSKPLSSSPGRPRPLAVSTRHPSPPASRTASVSISIHLNGLHAAQPPCPRSTTVRTHPCFTASKKCLFTLFESWERIERSATCWFILYSGLPLRYQGLKHVTHHLPPPRCALARCWSWKQSQDSNPGPLIFNVGCTSSTNP